ncbi:MAG: hypothetical protein ACYSUY_05070 [Planctomycetota bacterium]|jgi:hypothetical protein
MLFKRNLPLLSYLPAYKVFPEPVIYVPIRHSYLCAYKALLKHFGILMTYKAPFCTSLRLKRTCLPHEIAQRYLFGVISVAKNQLNPWLINDLRSTKDYVRKNKLFMQNEPKFRKVKLNVNEVLTTDYDKMDTWSIRKNEPKTNPILAQKTIHRTQTNPKQTQFQSQKISRCGEQEKRDGKSLW